MSEKDLTKELCEIVGNDWVKTAAEDLQHYGRDWTRQFTVAPVAVVLPACTEEVQRLVRLANERHLALVPSGGRTGLSGGAVAGNGEVVVALDRMNSILDFNASDRQLTCQAGVITEQLQQFADEHDLFYPVDFASAGSSQIGGNVATNAGGIKVIRYGMTRNWISGMKVVTGKGDILELNRGLTKNATGYDLRHLFIGSEGTLGMIVELTVSLCSKPADPLVLLLGVDQMADTMPILEAFQGRLALTAFEFFSEKALAHVISGTELPRPFETKTEFYVLIEFENRSEQDTEAAMELFEQCLEQGWISDGTLSQSLAQAESLWRFREDISETIAKFTPYKNDISVKISRVPQFLQEVDELVADVYPDFEIIWFGHIGDGNVHLNILKPEALTEAEFFKRCDQVSNQIFAVVRDFGGSISAEHGVGLLKKPYLHYAKDAVEVDYMRDLKRVFDPNNVLNPGKLLDMNTAD